MITIADGRKKLYQWDHDVKLLVDEKVVKIQFQSKFSIDSLLKDVVHDKDESYVMLPNILLQEHYDIYIFAIGESECVIDTTVIKVISRPKPPDYIYTEDDVYTVQKIVDEAIRELGNVGGMTEEEREQLSKNTSDIAKINNRVLDLENQVGNIDSALDSIIAIQNSYIGGGA